MIPDHLKDRLRQAREAKRPPMSQSDLARMAGCEPQTIQQLEAGTIRGSKYMPAIAEVLCVPLPQLLFGRDSSVPDRHVAEWLVNGLKKSGKTQRGLAGFMGVDQTAVTRMKRGERRIRLDEVPKIAQYLDSPLPSSEGQASDYSELFEAINQTLGRTNELLEGILHALESRPGWGEGGL